jgi:hypothetical protein
MSAPGLKAGREGQAGDGVTDQLALSAAEAADRIAHEHDLGEVIAAQRGTAKALAGTKLALDRNAMVGVNPEVRGVGARVRMLCPSSGAFVFVREFHLNVCCFPGLVEGRKAYCRLCGEDCSGCAVCE